MTIPQDIKQNRSTDVRRTTQLILRRQFLRSAAGLGVIMGLAPILLGNYARAEIPTEQLEQFEREFKLQYPAEQRDGYTYIKMDHVAPGGSGVTDVETLKLLYRRGSDPVNDPIFIVNYSYDGNDNIDPETFQSSENQRELLTLALPVLAKQSKRPIVYIDVTAIALDQNKPIAIHLGSLLVSLEENTIGKDGARADFKAGSYVIPYAQLEAQGEEIYDFTVAKYAKSIPIRNVQGHIATNLVRAIADSDDKLTEH